MDKKENKKTSQSLISELAFKLILDSEETEGYDFNVSTIDASGAQKLTHIDKQTVLSFLECDTTKVFVKEDEKTGRHYLMASNLISNETIKISGLADHYLTLLHVVDKATKTRKRLAKDPNAPLLTHEFIKEVNLSLQIKKYGEIGIGEYRDFDFLGNPVEMCVTTMIDGQRKPILSVPLCQAIRVDEEMKKLVKFANEIPSRVKNGEDSMKLVAMFHAKFIQIHPFRDGNGRTARLLTNYIFLSLDRQIVSIPINDKDDYMFSLDYINSVDIIKSAQDIARFPKFLIGKYHQLNPNNSEASDEEIFEFFKNYRTDENKYDFLIANLEKHQINSSSKNVIENILNDYGQKNIDFRFKVGSISVDQTEFEDVIE